MKKVYEDSNSKRTINVERNGLLYEVTDINETFGKAADYREAGFVKYTGTLIDEGEYVDGRSFFKIALPDFKEDNNEIKNRTLMVNEMEDGMIQIIWTYTSKLNPLS